MHSALHSWSVMTKVLISAQVYQSQGTLGGS
jgi:hypothetical protein